MRASVFRSRVVLGAAVAAMLAIGSLVSLQPAGAATAAGDLTVLESTANYGNWPGLDPATDPSTAVDTDFFDMVYGQLFDQGPTGPIPDLATGYKLSKDLKTLHVFLRHGVKFSDGTPFNAAAVAFSWKRELNPHGTCNCLPSFPLSSPFAKSITTQGHYEVTMTLSRPFAPIVSAFFSEPPNWIISPTALKKMGEKAFAQDPVGAGPFTVVSNKASTVLVLKKNPNYWGASQGLPKLNQIRVTVVSSDQSAYDALQAGSAQAYEAFSTYSLIPAIQKGGKAKLTPIIPSGTGASAVELNTTAAPFANLKAREAMYYATNPAPINKALYLGKATPTESLRSPGELFFNPKVPGYRTYDLAKAKALASQVGGLKIQLSAETSMSQLATALASEWNAAGINTTIRLESFEDNINDYKSNNWQVKLSAGGGYDPGILLGLPFWYASKAPFTGNHDPKLEALIEKGVAVANAKARGKVYAQIYKYISDQAFGPVLFSAPLFNLYVPGVTGAGFTKQAPQILWQDVSLAG